MIEEAQDRVLDLRPEAGQIRADFDRTLRLGRLQTLELYGLAAEASPGLWTISERLEPTMRALRRHCEEREPTKQPGARGPPALDCFASLAKTDAAVLRRYHCRLRLSTDSIRREHMGRAASPSWAASGGLRYSNDRRQLGGR